MAKLTLNNLLDMTKTHNEEQMNEIVLPWLVARYTDIYHRELGVIDKRQHGVFLYTVGEEIGHIDQTNDAGEAITIHTLGRFVDRCKEKLVSINHVGKTWVEMHEYGLVAFCMRTSIHKRERIDEVARERCDKFVWRLYHGVLDSHLEDDYKLLVPYMTDK